MARVQTHGKTKFISAASDLNNTLIPRSNLGIGSRGINVQFENFEDLTVPSSQNSNIPSVFIPADFPTDILYKILTFTCVMQILLLQNPRNFTTLIESTFGEQYQM